MYEELIHALRCFVFSNGTGLGFHIGIMDEAAEAIAALQAENAEKDKEIERLRMQVKVKDACISGKSSIIARVEAERDAAMAEIPHVCSTCKHKPQKYGVCGMGCEVDPLTIHHAERCNWEWRGAQGEG